MKGKKKIKKKRKVALDVPHDRGGAPLHPHGSNSACHMESTTIILLKVSKFATGLEIASIIPPLPPPQMCLEGQTVNRANLRAVINAADPVQRRWILAQATIRERGQAGRQTDGPRPRPSAPNIHISRHRSSEPGPGLRAPSARQRAATMTQNTGNNNINNTVLLLTQLHPQRYNTSPAVSSSWNSVVYSPENIKKEY